MANLTNDDGIKALEADKNKGAKWTWEMMDFCDAMIAKGIAKNMTESDVKKLEAILGAT